MKLKFTAIAYGDKIDEMSVCLRDFFDKVTVF